MKYRSFVFLSLLVGFTGTTWAQVTLTPVDAESKIAFKIRNFGLNVSGNFSGMQGTLAFDPENPLNIRVNISLDANTINTGIAGRDKHLRKEEYFGVDTYKRISFVSINAVKGSKENTYILYGNLTMKKTTKRVAIPFTYSRKANGVLFEGSFELNRRDYDVGGDSFSMSDDVALQLSVLVK